MMDFNDKETENISDIKFILNTADDLNNGGKSKIILVTGGAGFIGSNYAMDALSKGHQVVVLDNFSSGLMLNLKTVKDHPRLAVIRGDIRSGDAVSKVFAQHDIDTVVHFAAQSYVAVSLDEAKLAWRSPTIETNWLGTRMLLAQTAKHHRRLKKQGKNGVKNFHYISTDEVFGDISNREPETITAASKPDPSTPYAFSKFLGGVEVENFNEISRGEIKITMTYSPNNYGDHAAPITLIPRVVLKALAREKFMIYGDGSQQRDFIHVLDHVNAINLVMARGQAGHGYCIRGSGPFRVKQVVESVVEILDRMTPDAQGVSYSTLINYTHPRPDDDQLYLLPDEVAALGDYKMRTDFERELENTVRRMVNAQNELLSNEQIISQMRPYEWELSVGARRNWRSILADKAKGNEPGLAFLKSSI